MTITAPLGLLALAALPAVVALHLFRNRLPERRVAGLFLFPATAVAAPGGRNRAPLLRSPSFWLECAMALLLALWLSGPSIDALRPRHLVVVIDDSASMGARGTLPRARQALRELAGELESGFGASARVTVVRTGPQPTVVVGPRADTAALSAFGAGWLPQQPAHAPTAALDLGRQLAGDAGELWFVTDGEPNEPLPDVHVRACGIAADNAAVTSVRRERRADGDWLRIAAVAHAVEIPGGGASLRRRLRLCDGGDELAVLPVDLPGDGTAVELSLPAPPGRARLQVELLGATADADAGAADALAIDDVQFVVAVAARQVAIADQLGEAARRALRLDRVFAALPGWRAEAEPSRAWLLLREAPGELRDGQLEVVLAPTAGARAGHRSPFVVDRSHPLLAGAALEGIAWAAGGGELAGQVLVASGDKVLLAEQWPAAGRRLWFDLDGAAGNLTRAPDWPVMWANLLELAARDAPGCRRHQLRVGDELVRRGDGERVVVLSAPDGSERARGSGTLETVVDLPGHYELRAADGELLDVVAGNFGDGGESDLRGRVSFDRAPSATLSAVGTATVGDARPLRRWLSLLLLVLVAADWWWLARADAGGRR